MPDGDPIMPLRIFKRVPLVPGLRANISKSGISLSIGHRGAWYTFGPHGRRATSDGTSRLPPIVAKQPPRKHAWAIYWPSRAQTLRDTYGSLRLAVPAATPHTSALATRAVSSAFRKDHGLLPARLHWVPGQFRERLRDDQNGWCEVKRTHRSWRGPN